MKRIALASAAALAFAVPAAANHGSFDGTRVTAFGPPLTISASEDVIVRHGYTTGNFTLDWTALSAEEKQEFRSDAWRFELWTSVDGGAPTRVELTQSMHALTFTEAPGPAVLEMQKLFFVELPAGTFAPGTTVVLTGRWYGDSDHDDVSELEAETSRVVTFV